ncbi:truncated transposase IS4 family protein [Candidatus Moduliflexus flocculans]|uniref:Truncated transposase IS4 family protein n=1 Tax=Candidatus Moduliflexus flocculans TaxID=1499966 RepID=A0A081BL87_9BACT|nr:truncated transposase IS4 family protein [Candidatus Moduliflexus flocculans]
MRKRGKKPITLSSQDKLLLTCYSLRHYATFAQLGRQFGVHESYACEVYHASLDAIVKVLHLPGHYAVLTAGLAVLIDVTEQPIERPKRQQRA